ncbi:unnamed protein product [Tilletia laevis]|uniref:EF-hand domain-containing protein n=1 Tax=Tilletia caries TaxID=13290 RepID=A0A177UEQ9_9BASI|nr:hypothetical protein CF336_g3213 [Tilletia laevis]KAE8262310.1 hypothetical protein A4X03_0g2557 [Tilletia caries]CAD6904953.1 unnamed protein product [Tilletia controversa]KAE8205260.1 hypothetical protein CF335_g2360 [Tilletia laevis]CAD6886603.1 unnamed protein product [Tilletia caries]
MSSTQTSASEAQPQAQTDAQSSAPAPRESNSASTSSEPSTWTSNLSSYLWPFGSGTSTSEASPPSARSPSSSSSPPPPVWRPSYEEFRRHEPPQARLIRLRGLFDKLLDKSGESALANGRAKDAWTKSSIRARMGAGVKVEEKGGMCVSSDLTGKSSHSSAGGAAAAASSAAAAPSSGKTSQGPELAASELPQPSYATELLAKCKRSHDVDDSSERKRATQVRKEVAKVESSSSSSSPSSSTPAPSSSSASPLSGRERAADASRDGEAGWVGSGVWGLTAVSLDHLEDAAATSQSEEARLGGASAEEVRELEEREKVEREEVEGLRQRRIEWEGFLKYAEEKERELYTIFQDIDKNGDGIVDIGEIRAALERAGIDLGSAPLEDFTACLASARYYPSPPVSGPSEGSLYVTFPEFRDYLLLLPRKATMPEIFRFYQVRKAFGLFVEGGVFEELGRGWGRTKRGAAVVNFDGDVSLAGEEKMKGSSSSSSIAPAPSSSGAATAAAVTATAVQAQIPTSDSKSSRSQAHTSHPQHHHGAGHSSEGDDHIESTSGASSSASSSAAHAHSPAQEGEEEEEDEEEDDSDALHPEIAVKFLLAGGIAGAVSRTATAPFDRLKVYLITSAKQTGTGDVASGVQAVAHAAAAGTRAAGGGVLGAASGGVTAAVGQAAAVGGVAANKGAGLLGQAIVTLYRDGGGVKAFWVGNGLNVVKIFPESAIKFMSYEMSKRAFAKYVDGVSDSRDISGTSRFISGGIGGITSQLAIYPIETLKTRLMASQEPGKSQKILLKTAKDMWNNGGIRLYYRGLTAGLIGVFPYSAIDMSAFEGIKLFYIKYTGKEEPGVLALLAFGSISGSVGATTVYPLNLIRTRLQAAGTPAHPTRYDGFKDAVRQTYRNEGVGGFYRGLVPTLAKVVPAVSISYVVYEHSKRKLGVL